MPIATIEPPADVSPTGARLFEEWDRVLDAYLDLERAIDGWLFIGFDRGLRFDLDRVIEYATSLPG